MSGHIAYVVIYADDTRGGIQQPGGSVLTFDSAQYLSPDAFTTALIGRSVTFEQSGGKATRVRLA